MKASDLLVCSAGVVLAVGLSTLNVGTNRSQESGTTAVNNRDKTGTSTCSETTDSPPTREISMSASRQNVEAEGMGLEPTTGCPAPEFQSIAE